MIVHSLLRRLNQGDHQEFKVNLGYKRCCLKRIERGDLRDGSTIALKAFCPTVMERSTGDTPAMS